MNNLKLKSIKEEFNSVIDRKRLCKFIDLVKHKNLKEYKIN